MVTRTSIAGSFAGNLSGGRKAGVFVTGEQELIRMLNAVSDKSLPRVAAQAMGAGLQKIVFAQRREVKRAKTKGHSTKGIRRSIGRSENRRIAQQMARRKTATAKVGWGAGKANKTVHPIAHLYFIGTEERFTSVTTRGSGSGLARIQETGSRLAYRGRMKPLPAIRLGYEKSKNRAMAATLKKARQVLQREIKKQSRAFARRANKRVAAAGRLGGKVIR